MKQYRSAVFQRTLFVTGLLVFAAIGCNKEKSPLDKTEGNQKNGQETTASLPDDHSLSKVMTVAKLRTMENGLTQVLFNENAQILYVSDETQLNTLNHHYTSHTQVKVTFNPWEGKVISLEEVQQNNVVKPRELRGKAIHLDLEKTDATVLDDAGRLGTLNTTIPGLVNIIPDMATAQLMFNYITQQCCAVPGPYEIDQCISFQYAFDGCYARAHKMCWILNNTYHYDTHKIFSFANSGSDALSVHAQKWGGCCINWWYHVAPLVNIKTPSGVKAYVFDPAMFNQPVLLSVWLHAQENPVCSGTAHVSMINLQPTQSYSPSDYSGYYFDLDPWYWSTNYTLNNYSGLTTCW